MKNTLKYSSLLLVAFFFCKCDDNPKPDPCAGKIATTAEFTLYEIPTESGKYRNRKVKLYSDTVVFANYFGCNARKDSVRISIAAFDIHLYFESNDPNATSYLWIVGDNIQNFTASGLSLDFNSKSTPAFLDVKLIVSKTPNKTCHPTDDGKDTSVRRIYFRRLGAFEPHPMEGTYKGYLNGNIKDTITIDIKSRASVAEFNGTDLITNFPDNANYENYCDYSIKNIGRNLTNDTYYKTALPKRLYFYFITTNAFITDPDRGIGLYDKNKNMLTYESDYEIIFPKSGSSFYLDSELVNATFTGSKIN